MKKTVYLTSKQDGLKLHVLLMEPEQSPKGIVQICHGMAEHKERYEPFMQMLCSNGYISVIHDHRGHGKSVKDVVDLGYFYDDSGKAIIEDAHQVTTWMKERYGEELPYHLFGHSMGSLVVRCYLKKYDDVEVQVKIKQQRQQDFLQKLLVKWEHTKKESSSRRWHLAYMERH